VSNTMLCSEDETWHDPCPGGVWSLPLAFAWNVDSQLRCKVLHLARACLYIPKGIEKRWAVFKKHIPNDPIHFYWKAIFKIYCFHNMNFQK
jgi:hypothetical protein